MELNQCSGVGFQGQVCFQGLKIFRVSFAADSPGILKVQRSLSNLWGGRGEVFVLVSDDEKGVSR